MSDKKIDFSKWDKAYDIDGLRKDIDEVEKSGGGGDYEELPPGEYEVVMTKLELGETGEKSKNPGSPMVKGCFKVVAGEKENRLIFMNQVITASYGIHKMNEFLRSFDTNLDVNFTGFNNYGELLMDIAEEMDGVEFLLNVTENKSGFKQFEVLEIYD